MNPRSCVPRWSPLAAAVVLLSVAGCNNFFTPKHKVLVDSLSAPGALKPSGQSYRLVAKRSVVSSVPVQVSVVKACVDAALASVGMFEAAPNAPPDVVVEVSFGQDSTPRVDPAARETFLQLSARANPERSIDKATGAEMWDVRVAVLGISGRIETAMPLLCSVAASYIATDSRAETRIEVPQNSPAIVALRETALKALDSRTAPAAGALEGIPIGTTAGSPNAGAPANATSAAPVAPK